MSLLSAAVPNLIQGVSQQAAQQRRDSQCEEQLDCINSPVDGAIPRPGFDLVKFLTGTNFGGCFGYDIYRGIDEHYLVVILSGVLRVYDLADGSECTVTAESGLAYFVTGSPPKDVFVATTLGDYTFIANKGIRPAMGTAVSPPRPTEAIFYFKAGAYSATYTIEVDFGGTTYTWSYKTPDNSVSGNADYIATDQLAATFYNAMVMGSSVGPSGTALGFSFQRRGSSIRMWRPDGQAFAVRASDSVGDTYLKAIKGTVQAFSDLPKGGFDGFTVKVRGDSKSEDDDYYVRFNGSSESGGYWEETVAPNVPIELDAATMPHQLVNTGYRAFKLQRAPWGARVAGDLKTAKNPSFVGKAITDIFADHNRLTILTEGSCVWSKSRNPYVFLPDTAQTILATAPVDTTIDGKKQIALLRRGVQAKEATMLWAQKAQFRIHSGSDPFKQDTIEAPLTTSYEFAEKAAPCDVAQSLYFASEPGTYARIRDLFVKDGKPQDDTDVTAHIGRYIPSGVRYLTASDGLGLLMVFTEGAPSSLYCYNWLISDNQRVQSAWNRWRLPSLGTTILWTTCYRSYVYVLVQRDDGVAILRMDTSQGLTDPYGDYLTRVDFRVTESQLGTIAYDEITGRSTATLPYVPREISELGTERFYVVVAEDGTNSTATYRRGHAFPVLAQSGRSITLSGDCRGLKLYAGFMISAERQESEFYIRSDKGAKPVDMLMVSDVVYVHAKTGYYRAEVTYPNGKRTVTTFGGRYLGDPANRFNQIALSNGVLKVPIGRKNTDFTLRLVNDSYLPSAWQTAEWHYQAAVRAVPQQQG